MPRERIISDEGRAATADGVAPNKQPALDALIGQNSLRLELRYQIGHAISRKEPVQHILLCGPQGRGKTTFAQAVASESDSQCHLVSAHNLNKGAQLIGVLTKLGHGDVLAIRDIEAIPEIVSEYLLSAMHDFKVDITLDAGMHARSITMPLPPFTLIGTTTKPSRVNDALSQWMISYDLVPYTDDEMKKLLSRLAANEGFTLAPDVSELLVKYSESSPRTANVLLKRIKDQGFVTQGYLSMDSASLALRHLGYQHIAPNSRDLVKTLRAMPGVEFERFVADLFRRIGYSAELTAATGDHGIDIILRKFGRVIVVQCKQWDGAVGEPVLRDFYGSMVAWRADAGFVVTTSNFTLQAEAFAKGKPIELYDVDSIVGLYLDIGKSTPGSREDGLFREPT
jgi:Holliday junction DNA helicase RuvB